jgi:predicted DNA-binding WGR domain protein
MTSLSIRLEARSPPHRCHRAYQIAVSADLFGAWLVALSYGRIGTAGRTKARSFSTPEEAAAPVEGLPAQAHQRTTPDRCGLLCAERRARTGAV